MNTKTVQTNSSWDNVRLVLAILLTTGGVGAFYYFDAYSALLRVIGLLLLLALATTLAYYTNMGQQVWQFFVDSRMEIRKVVWPTQEETVQTTIVVFIMVLVMGVTLWLFDAMLVMIVRALTGQEG